MPADDGRIGTNTGTFAHVGLGVLPATNDSTAWIGDIGEDTGGAQKDIIAACHTSIQAHVVLNLAVPAQDHLRADHDVLSNIAAFTQCGAGHDVAKVPHFGASPNATALIDDRSFVGKP